MPRDYPFKPPRILMLTPSGRFEVNKPICTSFSDYHPESWDPSWSVQTIVLGLISFMLSEEMTAGGINQTQVERVKLAAKSLEFNFRNEDKFVELFGAYFPQVGICGQTKRPVAIPEPQNNTAQ